MTSASGVDTTAATGTKGSGTSGGGGIEQLPGDVPINGLTEAERELFCEWVTRQAQAYQATWGGERICTATGASVGLAAEAMDVTAARQRCAAARDTCLSGELELIVVDCAALSTCAALVPQVEAYYRDYETLDQRLSSCEALELDTLAGLDLIGNAVLPNCSLIGQPR